MPRVRPLPPSKVQRTVVGRLGRVADRVRQVATELGARPWRVFMVHTRATGEERGEGRTQEFRRVEILPTPRVRSLDNLTFNPYHAGVFPMGSLTVDEVSTSFTEDQLRGIDFPKEGEFEVPERYDFYYEVVQDGRQGGPVRPQRYRLLSQPFLDAENVQWVVRLERASGDGPRRDPEDD
jgi:hypothetical protein